MQRVLSFPAQSNRGFGDPSEFVTKRMCFSFMFSIGFLAILAGFLLGRFVFDQELELSRTKLRKAHQHHQQVFGVYKNYSEFNSTSLAAHVSATSLQQHLLSLRNCSAEDSARNLHEGRLIRTILKDSGFDLVSPLVQSQINLSFPHPDRVNQVRIVDDEKVILRCNDSRPKMAESSVFTYENAGKASGNIFYVNFGRDEDYHHLDSLGLSVKDSIVLARAGRLPALDLVTNALEHEASGVLLYLDPQQKELEEGFLSPADFAKLNSIHRRNGGSGAVPVLVITHKDAERIFSLMSTSELSSESWRGDLTSRYPIGPGFETPKRKMEMEVNTLTMVKKYYDVLGAIRGSQDPDRFVLLAHERSPTDEGRDSSAIVMEIIRVLGILKSKDWRPHRSIVVASWGLDGHLREKDWWSQLKTKAVAYLKVESALLGNDAVSRGTPLLEKVFRESAKALTLKNPSMDVMLQMGTDVDLVETGIPFLELKQFDRDSVNRMQDVTSFWSLLTWNLAESHGLPFSLDSYIRFFNYSVSVIEQRFQMIAQRHNLFLDSFFEAIQRLILSISSFQSKWSHADLSKSIEMRIMNDQFLQFAHVLACQADKSSFDHSFRHVIFSQSTRETDPRAGFGILQDLLRETTSAHAPDDLQQQILTHLAGLVECVNAARYALTDGLDTFIMGKNETTKLYFK